MNKQWNEAELRKMIQEEIEKELYARNTNKKHHAWYCAKLFNVTANNPCTCGAEN